MLKYNSLPRGKEGWAGATSLPEVFQGDINRREHQPGNVEPRNGSLFAPFHCVPSSFPLNTTDAYRSMQKRGSGGDETKENRPTLKFWGMISQ